MKIDSKVMGAALTVVFWGPIVGLLGAVSAKVIHMAFTNEHARPALFIPLWLLLCVVIASIKESMAMKEQQKIRKEVGLSFLDSTHHRKPL